MRLRDTFNPIAWEGFTPYNQLPPRTPLAARRVVRIYSVLLDKYAGRYGDPNHVLSVRREGDHLSVRENDELGQEIFPASQTDFFSKVTDDMYTFDFDSESHTIKLILHRGKKHLLLKRIE